MEEEEIKNEMMAYKAAYRDLSERERGEREADLYARLRPIGWHRPSRSAAARGGGSIQDWFTEYEISGAGRRATIRTLGEHAEILWRRIEDKTLSLHRAAQIAIDAKRHGEPLPEALAAELERYDSMGDAYSVHGRLLRRRKPRGRGPRKKTWEGMIRRGDDTAISDTDGTRDFWSKLRAQLISRFRAECELHTATDLASEFSRDLETVFDTYRARLRLLRMRSVATVSIPQLADACGVLNIDEPSPDTDLDTWLKGASRRRRILAKSYHPDINGGDAARDAYQQVIESFLVCERYVEERKSRRAPRVAAR